MDEPKPDEQVTEAQTTQPVLPATSEAESDAGGALDLVIDVPVRLTVEVGSTRMLVREVLQLDRGSVVELDRDSNEPADILVNGRLVARGQVTTIEDRLAIRVVEVLGGDAASSGPR